MISMENFNLAWSRQVGINKQEEKTLRKLLTLRQIFEDDGFDPDLVYLDPDDLIELEEAEAENEDED